MTKKTTKNATKETVKKETKNTTKEKQAMKKETKKAPVKKETKKTTPKKAPVKKEAIKKETPEKAPPENKKESSAIPQEKQFDSMCGAKFNADPSSTCFLMCKEEHVDDFQNCLSNYEELQKAKPASKKKLNRRKKKIDYFGDGVGTSASMINNLLICGASMAEIQEELEVKKTRVTGHFGGLKSQGSIKTRTKSWSIFRCKETNRYYFDEPDLPFYGHCDDCGNTTTKIK